MRLNEIYLALWILLSLGPIAAQSEDSSSIPGPNSIDSLMMDYPKSKGFIQSFFKAEKDKLMWAIPDSIIGRDLLMVTRFTQLPADYSGYTNAGSKTAERVVRFEKRPGSLVLREHSFVNIADTEDPIAESVQANNFAPILAVFDIENDDTNLYLIDVSEYFSEDSPGFNIINESNKKESEYNCLTHFYNSQLN